MFCIICYFKLFIKILSMICFVFRYKKGWLSFKKMFLKYIDYL